MRTLNRFTPTQQKYVSMIGEFKIATFKSYPIKRVDYTMIGITDLTIIGF